jgi:ribosomal protein S12 methylthiotransferase
MKRPASVEKTADRIKKWREICPDLAIRSSFIVGFPGETEDDFQFLLDWIEEVGIDRVACFKYENVVHAASRELDSHVPEEVKEDRYHRFMMRAQAVSAHRLESKIGREVDVLVDEAGPRSATGRTQWDAPEVDGVVKLKKGGLKPGDLVRVSITGADAYDLEASALEKGK